MVEDKKISESAELLLKGAKMLKYHCPDCLLPLFKDNEKVFCPSCKKEYTIEDNNVVLKQKTKKLYDKIEMPEKETTTEICEEANLITLIEKLMEKLIKRAISSESLNEIQEITRIVDNLTRILERIRSL